MRLQGWRDNRNSGGAVNAACGRAFTLVEVLFAVLILGIALLGLGAFFPTVIRQQQTAADATFGVLSSQSAEALTRGRVYPLGTAGATGNLEEALTRWASQRDSEIPDDASWLVPTDPFTGALPLSGNLLSPLEPRIPLADRLYPSDASGAKAPQFVWDLAVRRLAPRQSPDDRTPGVNDVQIAMFVRRVDPRLSAPRDATSRQPISLFRAIQDSSLPLESRRWPLSVNLTGASMGEPTLDGRVGSQYAYSVPMRVEVQFQSTLDVDQATGAQVRTNRDRLRVYGLGPGPLQGMGIARTYRLLGVPGQQFVDNLGNVYTVTGLDLDASGQPEFIRFTPPVPAGVGDTNPGDPTAFNSILMTPQAPAAILVFTAQP